MQMYILCPETMCRMVKHSKIYNALFVETADTRQLPLTQPIMVLWVINDTIEGDNLQVRRLIIMINMVWFSPAMIRLTPIPVPQRNILR